jgi:hypothetical protein
MRGVAELRLYVFESRINIGMTASVELSHFKSYFVAFFVAFGRLISLVQLANFFVDRCRGISTDAISILDILLVSVYQLWRVQARK